VEIELFAMGFVKDEADLHQQNYQVFGGEEFSDAEFALFYDSPGVQLPDHAGVDDAKQLHQAYD
jgi:hypothetical protein